MDEQHAELGGAEIGGFGPARSAERKTPGDLRAIELSNTLPVVGSIDIDRLEVDFAPAAVVDLELVDEVASSVRAHHRNRTRRRQHLDGERRQLGLRRARPLGDESKRAEGGERNGGELARAERHRVSSRPFVPPQTPPSRRAPRRRGENGVSTARSRGPSRARSQTGVDPPAQLGMTVGVGLAVCGSSSTHQARSAANAGVIG